jgi:hypothetical protein
VTNLGLHDGTARTRKGGEDIATLIADVSSQVANPATLDDGGEPIAAVALSSFVARDRARRIWCKPTRKRPLPIQPRWAWYMVTPLDPEQEPDPRTGSIYVTGEIGYSWTRFAAVRALKAAINDYFGMDDENTGRYHRIADDIGRAAMWAGAIIATVTAFTGDSPRTLLTAIVVAWVGAATRAVTRAHWDRTHPDDND